MTGTTNGITIDNFYFTTVTGELVPTLANIDENLRSFVAGSGGIEQASFDNFPVSYVSGYADELVISIH